MPDGHAFLLFGLASAALIAVPGPSVVYIVTRGVSQGRGAGLLSMLGVEAGGLVHVVAATLGLSAVLASSSTAFTVVKYAGAAYLVLIGVRKLMERPDDLPPPPSPRASRRIFLEGVLVNTLNPKTALFFLAFLPQFIDPGRGSIALQALLLGLVFIAIAVVSDSLWALLAGRAGASLRTNVRRRLAVSRASGGVYVSLGLVAALTGERPRT